MSFHLNKNDEIILSTIILSIIIIIIISNFSKISSLKSLLYSSSLGRLVILIFLVYITSYNKMFGLLFLLTIILLDNSNSIENNSYYLEGFSKINVSSDNNVNPQSNQNTNKTLSINTNTDLNTDINKKPKTATIEPLEGRDMIGLETNLKRGKQSNSIPVNPSMYESEDVLPNEPDENGFESFSSNFK